MVRGDITAGQAADRAYQVQDTKDERLQAVVQMLHDAGHLDRLGDFDPEMLVQALAERVVPGGSSARRSLAAGDRRPPQPRLAQRPARADDDLLLDEDDLLLDEDELNDDL